MKRRKLLESFRRRPWWQLLLAATGSGIVAGSLTALFGVLGTHQLAAYLNRGKQTTELGDAVLAIYVFLTLAATGFVAAFSGTYGIARRRAYASLLITCATLGINVVGFFVPTGGYALLPFYCSLVAGVGLTLALLIRKPGNQHG